MVTPGALKTPKAGGPRVTHIVEPPVTTVTANPRVAVRGMQS